MVKNTLSGNELIILSHLYVGRVRLADFPLSRDACSLAFGQLSSKGLVQNTYQGVMLTSLGRHLLERIKAIDLQESVTFEQMLVQKPYRYLQDKSLHNGKIVIKIPITYKGSVEHCLLIQHDTPEIFVSTDFRNVRFVPVLEDVTLTF